MAASQSSSSKLVIPPPPPSDDEMTESDSEEVNPPPPPPPAKKKRNRCPGIRIVGKTCHQCGQKPMVVFASCKTKITDENGYGERVEEVNQLTDWRCPKCRNICNCSACRRKIGLPPTGCLVYKVRDNGLLSAAEFLDVQGPQNVCMSPKKRKASRKKTLTKEGSLDNTKKGGIDDMQAEPYHVANLKRNGVKTNHKIILDIPLPQGVDLTIVAGIDLSQEDAAHALQFLEFCKSFEEVLNMKEGQAESILQELTDQCNAVGFEDNTLVVQFYIQLLSLMHKDKRKGPTLSPTNNESWWLQDLEKVISESNHALMNLPSECFAKDVVGYEFLDSSKKLRLVNFLCDESLNTGGLRSRIGEDNSKLYEGTKEAKGKVVAAKEKEKLLKQKMAVAEVAKASMSKNGDQSSIYEHENLVSQIKAELSQTHVETLEAKDMVLKSTSGVDIFTNCIIYILSPCLSFLLCYICSQQTC